SGQERMPDASLPPGTTVHGDGLRFTGSNGQEYTVRVKRGDGPTRTVRNPDGTFDIFIGKDVPQHVAVRSVADEIASLAGTPRQTSNSLDTLYEHAAVAQRELGDLTRSIADE